MRALARCALLLAVFGTGSVLGQTGASLRARVEVSTVAERIVEVDGPDGAKSNQLVAVAAPTPGEEIIYTVTFTNTGGAVADGVRITSPIPPEVRYLEGTAYGPGCDVLFSVDGGRSFGAPAELRVTGAAGARATAEASNYTHIRWVLVTPLAPGAKGFARFRAVGR